MKVLLHMIRPAAVVLATALLSGGTLGAAERAEGDGNERVMLILGDSITAGYGVDRKQAFPAQLEQTMKQAGWNIRVVNGGLSGDTSAGGARRINWLLRQKVDILLVELGGNDGLRGLDPDATRTNLQTIIDRARAKNPEVMIVLAGMQMPRNMGEAYRKKFAAIYPELAEKNQAVLIPFLLEGVGGDPKLNLPDQIHPTAAGHRIIARTVWTVLEPALKKRK